MKALLLGVLFLLPAADAADLRPVDPRDFAKSQRLLQVDQGPAGPIGSRESTFTLADRELVVEVSELREIARGTYRFELTQQRRIVLDEKDAAKIWSGISELGISSWKEAYQPSDLNVTIYDGTRWSVLFREGKKEKRIWGSNVYPALSPLGAPTLEIDGVKGTRIPTAYHRLLEIIRALDKKE